MKIYKAKNGLFVIAKWDNYHNNYVTRHYTREYKNWHRCHFGKQSLGAECSRSINDLAKDSNIQTYTRLSAAKKALIRDYPYIDTVEYLDLSDE